MQVKETIQEERRPRVSGAHGERVRPARRASVEANEGQWDMRWWEAEGWIVQSSQNQFVEFGNGEPLEGL